MRGEPPADKKNDFDDAVNFERVKVLYKAAASHGLLSSFVVILFIPLFMWSRVDHTIIIIWTISIVLVNTLRSYLSKQFNLRLERNEITKDNASQWELYFVAGISLTALVWVSASFFPFQKDVLASMLYVLLIHVGANAAIVSMYMASKFTMLAYLTITLIPGSIWVAWQGGELNLVVGMLGFVFVGIMVLSIYAHNQNLIETINLRFVNEDLSKKDTLTGLWNRRQLYDFINKLIPASTRHHLPFSIMMLDIDHFKHYNDNHGHTAGDVVLTKVAQIILANTRSEDLAVRYGGEEFMIILVGMEIANSKVIAERLRISVREETEVTISSGLVEFEPGLEFDELIKKADSLLYKAKNAGRDVTIVDDAKNATCLLRLNGEASP